MELDKQLRDEPLTVKDEADETVDLDLMVLLVDFYRGLKKYWWLIILVTLAASALTLYLSLTAYQPLFNAEATFTVSNQSTTGFGSDDFTSVYDYGTVTQMANTFPYILKSDLLQQVIREDLGVSKLNCSISAKGLEDTNLFILTVTSASRTDALEILNSAIYNYPKVAEFIIGDTQMNMLSDPSVGNLPYNQVSYLRQLLKGALIGFVTGLVLVAVYALLRRTVRNVDEIETKLNQRSIAVLPKVTFKHRSDSRANRLIILNKKVSSSYKESIRGLRSRTVKTMDDIGAKTLMVTSTLAGEGKDTIALNLALSIAQTGARVALVDADLRSQDLHTLLDMKERSLTLADVLRGEASLEQASFEMLVKGFFYVPCGLNKEHSVEKLSTSAFMQVLKKVEEGVDFLIINTPPCGMLADALTLAGMSDCVLYVIRQDTAHISSVIDGLQNIGYTGTNILGCVLNAASKGFAGYGYGYGYGYGGRYAYGSRYSYGKYGVYGQRSIEGNDIAGEAKEKTGRNSDRATKNLGGRA